MPNIKFDVSQLKIKNILHIQAQNEWRKNFAFTPTGSGNTVGMLGSHSDIGGGYAELDYYNPCLLFFDVPVGNTTMLHKMKKYRDFYLNACISTENSIYFKNTYDHYNSEVTIIEPGHRRLTSTVSVKKDANHTPTKSEMHYSTHSVLENKAADHYVLKDKRYISNKLALVPMYTMLQEAIASKVPFYKNYDETKIKPPYKFEYELPDDPLFKQYLELMQDYVKNRKKATQSKFFIPSEVYKHIMKNYVHLSAHYGGLSNAFINVKSGDHHPLGALAFINQPVKPTVTNGVVSYEREIYP